VLNFILNSEGLGINPTEFNKYKYQHHQAENDEKISFFIKDLPQMSIIILIELMTVMFLFEV
jgi:hypothetical protein